MTKLRTATAAALALGATLACAASPALAQRRVAQQADEGPWVNPECAPGYSTQSQDRARYDCSGTRGRIGLGASPFNPEGPGNVSTSGR